MYRVRDTELQSQPFSHLVLCLFCFTLCFPYPFSLSQIIFTWKEPCIQTLFWKLTLIHPAVVHNPERVKYTWNHTQSAHGQSTGIFLFFMKSIQGKTSPIRPELNSGHTQYPACPSFPNSRVLQSYTLTLWFSPAPLHFPFPIVTMKTAVRNYKQRDTVHRFVVTSSQFQPKKLPPFWGAFLTDFLLPLNRITLKDYSSIYLSCF